MTGRWAGGTAAAVAMAMALQLPVLAAAADSTTSTTSSVTTTTTVPPAPPPPPPAPSTTAAPAPTTTTAPPAPATTTTTLPPPGAGVVPPPPPPPPVPPIPDLATKLAQAAILEQKITSQGAVLDRLSDTYNQAHQVAVSATLRQADAEAQLAAGQASEAQAVAAIAAGQQALRRAALDAYLDNRPLPQTRSIGTAAQAYELGIANVYSSTAVETDAERVRALHAAEAKLRDLGVHMQVVAKQAAADGVAAQKADHKAQVAVDQAIAGQAALLTTLGQIQGDLGVLVAVQQATLAMAAYNQLSQAGTLLFTPSGPLPPELAETTMAISTALAQVGKPYVWGGTGPNVFDCSGLMQWSWAQLGVAMPRVAADQQAWAIPVPISQVQPGDLVFFGNPAHHVGMYVGNGLMVEAPHTGAVVDVVPVWSSDLVGFGRAHR